MPYAAKNSDLAAFQQELVGSWTNQDFGKDENKNPVGGPENPLSYNVMPLPQTDDPDGYILKNFKFYETLNFNDSIAIAAVAPNRGGLVSQNARALFYEQQVKFAEGPAKDTVVHVENGAWLWLPRFVQQDGPYPANVNAQSVSNALQQPADAAIAKQISIPHGNSVLALGSFDTVSKKGGSGVCMKDPVMNGSPVIPDAPFPYPVPANPVTPPPALISDLNVDARYTTLANTMANFQNPHPLLTQCPNRPLQEAVAIIQPDSFMHWRVTTEPLEKGMGSMIPGAEGVVTNIPFEQRVADVTAYWADYWLLYKKDGKDGRKKHKYLAYTQTILMVMTIKGKEYSFPHVTCNTVTHT
ncbi:MAG TPA: heme-binding protein [Acidobacteriaceae bacterium]|nr:heme-binding protein [Acidobacteriaceae bacterium]